MGLEIQVEGDERPVLSEKIEEIEAFEGLNMWVRDNEVDNCGIKIGEEGL